MKTFAFHGFGCPRWFIVFCFFRFNMVFNLVRFKMLSYLFIVLFPRITMVVCLLICFPSKVI